MRIRKANKFLLPILAALIFTAPYTAARAESTVSAAPQISARAAVLADMDSGQIIYARCENDRMRIASTTKIMTALVALSELSPDDTVKIRKEWTGIEGSSMYLEPGAEYTVRQLLYGLMLASGNDAAHALACAAAGSIEDFAALMNGKAAELGMTGSHFTNPHGLDDPEHYSTAADMAKLTAAAMKNPEFKEIVSTKDITIGGHSYKNHNKLLWQYEGAIGVKTGFTKASGRTLVGCARRGDMGLICVTLDDGDDWSDHAALFDWGFENYENVTVGGQICNIPVQSGDREQVSVSCPESRLFTPKGTVTRKIYLPDFVYAPVTKGDIAGRLRLYDGERQLAEYELRYDRDVDVAEGAELSFFEKLRWAWYFACRYGYRTMPVLY